MSSIQRERLAAQLPAASSSMSVDQDLFSLALSEQGRSGSFLVERERAGLHPTSLSWWLRDPDAPAPFGYTALSMVVRDGPVLDVGCATGRHLERLRAAGIEAEGIDVNPFAVDLAQSAGCVATCADVWRYPVQRQFRWLLALGNNIGIAGSIAALPHFLARMEALLVPGGQMLLSSVVPDLARSEAGNGRGGYPGEMKLRHHYAGRVGAWFDWLYVDPATLAGFADVAGFRTAIIESAGADYLAVLTKEQACRAA